MAEIKDSGERTEFDSGAVRDMHEGKGRCDLLPLDEVAHLLHYWDAFVPCRDQLSVIDALYLFMTPPHTPKSDEDFIFSALVEFSRQNEWDVPTMLLEVSKHFEAGCQKYGERNWEKGIPAHCYLDSAIRHYLKWLRGDEDEPHNRAFCWNLLCLLWTLHNKPECNDIPSYDNERTKKT